MARITESLIRKRAEHNDCQLSNLEEVSLHQLDIERIEHLDKWCKELKILYLQSNLIPKIENVSRLKQLEYLNLALNNISLIENLEGCEFLNKLDLTLNFVGRLTSVESLRANIHLKELYLVGNPSHKFDLYREYVAATLPQLVTLDGTKIERSDRLRACQELGRVRARIVEQEEAYEAERELEKAEEAEKWSRVGSNEDGEKDQTTDETEKFDPMNDPMKYTPESRVAVHKYLEEQRNPKKADDKGKVFESSPEMPRRLEKDGKMLNVNEGRYKFSLRDDPSGNFRLLEVEAPRYMDTSLISCDVQPTYVRVTLKGKVLQLVFQEVDEVHPDQSQAQRCQTTGNLVVKMKRVSPTFTHEMLEERTRQREDTENQRTEKHTTGIDKKRTAREFLEVDPAARQMPNFSGLAGGGKGRGRLFLDEAPLIRKGVAKGNFVDDPDVPPLM